VGLVLPSGQSCPSMRNDARTGLRGVRAFERMKREGTSTVARKVSATTGPTPGVVISLRQTSSWRTISSAIVAVARRLAVIMHRMWVDGTEFRWTKQEAAAT